MNSSAASALHISECPALFVWRAILIPTSVVTFALHFCTAVTWLRSKERHVNHIIIFFNISFAAMLTSLSQLARTTNYFLNYKKPNGLVVPTRSCRLTEFMIIMVPQALYFLIIGATNERIVSVRYHSTYERWPCALGLFLIAVAWVQAIITYFFLVFFVSQNDTFLPYCSVAVRFDKSGAVGAISLCNDWAMMYLYCWKTARKLLNRFTTGEIHLSLSSRLQLRHNLDAAITLLPTILWHFAALILMGSYRLIVMFALPLSNENKILYALQADLFISIYFTVDAVIVLYFIPSLRQKLMLLVPRFLVCSNLFREHRIMQLLNQLLRNENQFKGDAKYFEALESFWRAAAKTSSRNYCYQYSSPTAVNIQDCSNGNEMATSQERDNHVAEIHEDNGKTVRNRIQAAAEPMAVQPGQLMPAVTQPITSNGAQVQQQVHKFSRWSHYERQTTF